VLNRSSSDADECIYRLNILATESYAAERCQCPLLRHISKNTTLTDDFFRSQLETDYTSNEVACALIDCYNDNLVLIQRNLENDFLYQKVLIVCAKSMVCFYVRCLISNHQRALLRLKDNIKMMTGYFHEKVGKTNSTLLRIIANELWILEVIHECLQSATSTADNSFDGTSSNNYLDSSSSPSSSSIESFIVVIHKRTGGNTMVTRTLTEFLYEVMTHCRQI
jgi:hypothetical protein